MRGLQDKRLVVRPSRGRTFFGEGDTNVADDKLMSLSNLDWFDVWDGDGYYVQSITRSKIIYAEPRRLGRPRGLGTGRSSG